MLSMFIESLLNIKFSIDALKDTVYLEGKNFTLKEYDVYLGNQVMKAALQQSWKSTV